jgi:hypothetical protein
MKGWALRVRMRAGLVGSAEAPEGFGREEGREGALRIERVA